MVPEDDPVALVGWKPLRGVKDAMSAGHPTSARGGRLRRRSPAVSRRRPSTSRRRATTTADMIERKQLARLHRSRRARVPSGPVLPRPLGRPPGFDPSQHQDARRPVAGAVVHRRRHPQEHRGAPAVGRLPGRHPGPARCREPMRVYMSGGTTGKSRPTFYTQWDREVGAVLTARGAVHAGHPPRRRRAQLVGVRHCTTARSSLRRGAVPLAQLRRAHHQHRQRDQQREAGASWRSSTARPPS